jgi:hypothetical protein
MEEYVFKTVQKSMSVDTQKGSPITCSVKKSRNSEGFGSIELIVDNRVALRLDTNAHGSLYTTVAKQLASLLNEVADAPCEL